METNNHRLLHTFSALADLGQEVANAADFEEMLRTSFHLLLGSLAIRRGAVAEFDREREQLRFLTARGLSQTQPTTLSFANSRARQLTEKAGDFTLRDAMAEAARLMEEQATDFAAGEIELVIPLIVRDEFIGIVLLGEKASEEKFAEEDLEVITVLARHIGVGIHSHRLLEEVERRA